MNSTKTGKMLMERENGTKEKMRKNGTPKKMINGMANGKTKKVRMTRLPQVKHQLMTRRPRPLMPLPVEKSNPLLKKLSQSHSSPHKTLRMKLKTFQMRLNQ
jgi:DNA-binding Xre family transcriptional regulator